MGNHNLVWVVVTHAELTAAAVGTLAMTMGSSTLSAAVASMKEEWPGYDNRLYILGECSA